MRGVAVNPQLQQILAVCVPILAMVISLAGVYPAGGRYGALSKEVQQKERDLAKLKATPLPPRDPVLPAVNDAPGESAQFLGQLVSMTAPPRSRFMGLESKAGEPRPGEVVRPVRSRVEIDGDYPELRRYVARLNTAPRLFVVTSLDCAQRANSQTGAGAGLHATIEVERYVVPPAPAPSAAEGEPGAAGGEEGKE